MQRRINKNQIVFLLFGPLFLYVIGATLWQPRLYVNRHDSYLNILHPGQVGKTTFILTNYGLSNLAIDRVASSCSCTTVPVDHVTIRPWQSFYLNAEMKADDGPGEQQASIVFYTNEPHKSATTLTIRALIDPIVSIIPSIVDFNIVTKLPSEQMFRIIPVFGRSLNNLLVQPLDSKVGISINGYNPERGALVTVNLPANTPIGLIKSSITVSTGDFKVSVPIVGQVIGGCHSDPNSIFLGLVDQNTSVTKEISLFGINKDGITFNVQPPEMARFFRFTWTHANFLNVTLLNGVPKGRFEATLSLNSEHSTVLQIPIYAVIVGEG